MTGRTGRAATVPKLSVSNHLNNKKKNQRGGLIDATYPVIRIDRFGDEDMAEFADTILFPI